MQTNKYLRGVYALVFVTFGMIGSASAARNTSLSDIWWDPNESGWGMQMVNTGTFAFATIYVYGANGTPTWFTGQLNSTAAAPFTYTGPLYATTGPYFGGFFNSGTVSQRQVGTMTFVLTNVRDGQLNYSVDGVVVNKSVQRTPLTFDTYSGFYKGYLTETLSNCFDTSGNRAITSAVDISIAHAMDQMSHVWTGSEDTCTYIGTYSQLGRFGTFNSNLSCSDGDVGTMLMFEMTNDPFRFTARFTSTNTRNGCKGSGYIVGVKPQ